MSAGVGAKGRNRLRWWVAPRAEEKVRLRAAELGQCRRSAVGPPVVGRGGASQPRREERGKGRAGSCVGLKREEKKFFK